MLDPSLVEGLATLVQHGKLRVVLALAVSLGLSHIHPHDFRHWRATQRLREGVWTGDVATTALRQRYIEDLQLRGLSPRTQDAYVRVARQLAEHSVSTWGRTTRM